MLCFYIKQCIHSIEDILCLNEKHNPIKRKAYSVFTDIKNKKPGRKSLWPAVGGVHPEAVAACVPVSFQVFIVMSILRELSIQTLAAGQGVVVVLEVSPVNLNLGADAVDVLLYVGVAVAGAVAVSV